MEIKEEELPVIDFSGVDPEVYKHDLQGSIDIIPATPDKIGVPAKVGRPSDYTQELADRICDQLSEGISLRTICLAEDMPNKQTVFSWMRKHKEFLDQYARAKDESADALFEETIDIADGAVDHAYDADPKAAGAVVNAVRLQVDTRKWMMSKMKPKKYGDKIDHTTDGKAFPTPIMQLNVQSNNNAKELGE